MKNGICYVDGEFVPAAEANVSIFDRGFTSGEGVYDVTRSYGHKLFKLDAHVARLYRSLVYTYIDCGISPAEMTRLSIEIFERNKHLMGPDDDCALWQIVSRGAVRFGGAKKDSTVVIFCVPVAFEGFARNYLDGLKLVTPSTRRTPPQCLESKAKITNKMNHAIALYEAQQVDPKAVPLMLDLDGNISETNSSNFFFVSGGRLCTATDRNVLQGVTRATVFELAADLGIPVVEGNFTPYDVYTAEEAFIAGTSPTMVPVKSLNGRPIGKAIPGPTMMRLITAWNEMVGLDYVGQALAHLKEPDKQSALGLWAQLRNR
jgi:branched-chain amino acid aminotransferase